MQFWPPDDEQMCSKHVEGWNKLNVKQTFFASSWLITEINYLISRLLKKTLKWKDGNELNIVNEEVGVIYVKKVIGKGKVIPLQVRCGPEGG